MFSFALLSNCLYVLLKLCRSEARREPGGKFSCKQGFSAEVGFWFTLATDLQLWIVCGRLINVCSLLLALRDRSQRGQAQPCFKVFTQLLLSYKWKSKRVEPTLSNVFGYGPARPKGQSESSV